jgi:hypothetical protein
MTALHGGWAGDLVLIIAVSVVVVGFLLVFLWTRRPPGDRAAEAPEPPAMDRAPDGMPAPMLPDPFRNPESFWIQEPFRPGPMRPPEQLRPPERFRPPSEATEPQAPSWAAAEPPSRSQPLERRHPLPPDAAFSLTEPSSEWSLDGARHRAADPPAPAMLSNRALLAGRVMGPDGSPVSGARLTVSDFHGSPAGIGHSATDGRYRLHLPTGGTYLLLCTADGHQTTTVMVTVAVATLACDIVLGGAGGIDGWVRHQYGEPAAGATVTLTDLRGEVVASTMAGGTGGYRLTGLNAGEYTLVVSAAGAQPGAYTVQVPASGVGRVDMVLQSNGALRGTVRAANGARPVPDASVALVDGSGGVVAALTTGADGEYVFAEVPPGRYTLVASGYPPVATLIELTGERTEVRDVILGADGRAERR